MATAKVLNIVELLEAILVHVEMRTLLFSQRVNKTFRNCIQGSSKLRQKLWLEPGDGGYFRDEHLRLFSNRPRINPLLELDWFMFTLDVRHHKCLEKEGLVVVMNCRGLSAAQKRPKSESWRDMLIVSQHEPDFQFQVWREESTTKRPKCDSYIYYNRPPTAGELVDHASEQSGVVFVAAEGKIMRSTEHEEIESMLQSWRRSSTLPDPERSPFTRLSRQAPVRHDTLGNLILHRASTLDGSGIDIRDQANAISAVAQQYQTDSDTSPFSILSRAMTIGNRRVHYVSSELQNALETSSTNSFD